MREIKKRSTVPYYLVMVVWVVWALFLPLYSLLHLILALVVSVVVFKLARIAIPDKVVLVPEEPQPTGNPQLDALIAQKDAALAQMRKLDEAIAHEAVSENIRQISGLTEKIVAQIVRKPEKLGSIKPFMNYYLPTTLKLLNAYAQMDEAGVAGDNITATQQKIETMMATIAAAFARQLDALFGAEALDIATDITVLEQMMAQEGLTGGATAQAASEKPIELKL